MLAAGASSRFGDVKQRVLLEPVLERVRASSVEDVLVVLGGTIPAEDADELKEKGVAAVFTPGAPTSEIVEFLRARVPA